MRVLPSVEDLQAIIRDDPAATVTVPARNLLAYIQNFQAVAQDAQLRFTEMAGRLRRLEEVRRERS